MIINYILVLFTLLLGIFSVGVMSPVSLAQQEDLVIDYLVADIDSENSVEVGRNIIFSAQNTLNETGVRDVSYLWEFDDGTSSDQEEVVHIYSEPGIYNIRLYIEAINPLTGSIVSSEMTKEVFVYVRSVVILTDLSNKKERVGALTLSAEEENVFLQVLDVPEGRGLQKIIPGLVEGHIEAIQDANVVILWSDQIDTLNALNPLRGRVAFFNKDIVVVSEGSLGVVKGVMKGVFSVLEPKRMIITRREAIDEFFTTEGDRDIVEVIVSRGYDFELLTEQILLKKSIWDFPSLGIQFLQRNGVSDVAILYILLLGVIITLVAFLKLVVGLSSVGLRIPVVLTYLFLVMGGKMALLIVLFLMATGYGVQRLIRKQYLLYTAKVAVIVSFLSLLMLFLIGIVLYFIPYEFDLLSVIVMILVGVLMERMVSVEAEHGVGATLQIFAETLLVTLITYWIVQWSAFQLLLLARPEILVLFIIANLFMGRFTGLRIMEYFRFREVLRFTEEE